MRRSARSLSRVGPSPRWSDGTGGGRTAICALPMTRTLLCGARSSSCSPLSSSHQRHSARLDSSARLQVSVAGQRRSHGPLRRVAGAPPPRGHRHRDAPDAAAAVKCSPERSSERATSPATTATARSSCSTSPARTRRSTPTWPRSESRPGQRLREAAPRSRRLLGQLLGNPPALRGETARRPRGSPPLPRLTASTIVAAHAAARSPRRRRLDRRRRARPRLDPLARDHTRVKPRS